MLAQTMTWSPLSAVIPNLTPGRRARRTVIDPTAVWLTAHGFPTKPMLEAAALGPAWSAEVADQYHSAWLNAAAAQEAELFDNRPEDDSPERLVPPEALVHITLPNGRPVVAKATAFGPKVEMEDVPDVFQVLRPDGSTEEGVDFTAAFDTVCPATIAADRIAAIQAEAIALAKQAADAASADLLMRLEVALSRAEQKTGATLRTPEVAHALDVARAAIQAAERAATLAQAAEIALGFAAQVRQTEDPAMLAEIVHAAEIAGNVIGATVTERIADAIARREAELEREAAIAGVKADTTAALAVAATLADIAAVESELGTAQKKYGVAFARYMAHALANARRHVARLEQRRTLETVAIQARTALASAANFDDVRKVEADLREKEAASGLRFFTPAILLCLQAARRRIRGQMDAPIVAPVPPARAVAEPRQPKPTRNQPAPDYTAVEAQALQVFATAASEAEVRQAEQTLRAANKAHRHNFFTPAMLAARADAFRRLRRQAETAAVETIGQQALARLAAASTLDAVRAEEKALRAANKAHRHDFFSQEIVAALTVARRRCRAGDLHAAREAVVREARAALTAAQTRGDVLAVERFLRSANKQYRQNFFDETMLAALTTARRRCRGGRLPSRPAPLPVTA